MHQKAILILLKWQNFPNWSTYSMQIQIKSHLDIFKNSCANTKTHMKMQVT